MKRKLRLLLAVVLAMTMVMGIGLSAYAAELPADYTGPDTCECSEHPGSKHFYATGKTFYITTPDSRTVECNEVLVWSLGPDGLFTPSDRYDGVSVDLAGGILQQGWYYQSGSELYACPGHSTSPHPSPTPTPAGPSSPAHTHNFQWQTIIAPTKDADGLEGEVCSCGATRNTQPLSAYGYALNDYAVPMINAAKSGQTITFEFGELNSFPKSFMEKLVEKNGQNVTFVFHYNWNHQKQEITIPAGTPIDLNFDWYGPAKMAELYGTY